MVKKKKVEENIAIIEVVEDAEDVEAETPRKHIVQVKVEVPVRGYNVKAEVPVGEIIYWESTQDITYSFEAGHQIYMDNLVGRALKLDANTWVPRANTRKWIENLPKAILDEGYFTSEVLSLYETE